MGVYCGFYFCLNCVSVWHISAECGFFNCSWNFHQSFGSSCISFSMRALYSSGCHCCCCLTHLLYYISISVSITINLRNSIVISFSESDSESFQLPYVLFLCFLFTGPVLHYLVQFLGIYQGKYPFIIVEMGIHQPVYLCQEKISSPS